MFFTVIMPTYKVDKDMFIAAINSVLDQSFKDWELLIVDDNEAGSIWKKATHEVEREIHDPRVKFYYHKTNNGANAARNTGVRNAQGSYLSFLDSDDVWLPNFLFEFHQSAINDETDLLSCAFIIKTNKGKYLLPEKERPEGHVFDKLIYEDFVGPTSAVVAKRETLIQVGGFDDKLPARQDYDMWLRICKIGTFKYINKPLMILSRVGQESISMRGNNHVKGTEMVLKKLLQDPELSNYSNDLKYSHYMESGIFLLNSRDYKQSREYLKKALTCKKQPYTFAFYICTFLPHVYDFIRKNRRDRLIRTHSVQSID